MIGQQEITPVTFEGQQPVFLPLEDKILKPLEISPVAPMELPTDFLNSQSLIKKSKWPIILLILIAAYVLTKKK